MTERIAAATRDTFRSLRVRNFRLFFVGQSISQVGTWLQFVGQTLLILRLTDSGVALGLLAAVQFLPMLVLGAWAGVVTDRLDKRRLMTITQAAGMAVALVLGAIVVAGHATVGVVYVAAFLTGIAMTFDNPARRVLVNELVRESDVSNAVSLNSTLMTASRMVGPVLAGVLVGTVGIGWCFVLNGLSFVAVLIALHRVDPAAMRRTALATRGRGQLRDGLRYVWRTPDLRNPLLLLAAVATLGYNHLVLLPLLVQRELGGTDTTYTVLAAVMSLGAVVGSLWLARRRELTTAMLGRAAVGIGIASAAMSVSPSAWFAAVTAIGVGVASIVVLSGTNTLLQLRAEPVMRGRVLALFGVVFIGTMPIGAPIAGWIADVAGTRVSLAVGALVCVVSGLGAIAATRRLPRRQEDTSPALSPVLEAA